ncbi:MAG: hypothetical protein IJ833_02665, partial [Lachnospiraceae bacterium]|nr:hypothetical protein [Lachnospiraceae bacterium]
MKEHLKKWNQRFEAYPRRLPEYLAFVLYLCLNLIVGYFHEPWFDEALAWQIARHCSIIDILFYIPHYEGHPPLWHLLLLPFARLGAPYEWSLLLVSVAIMSVAVGLLLKYAPFPRIIKLLLPFTFFLGYQYSVISRPYSLMFLAFVILAYRYGQRNTKPLHYILALMFLCLTNAYGIVFAGGLALVWIWEIWNRQTLLPFMKEFLKDKRCWGLAVLLVWALALIAEFMPYSDTFSNRATVTCGLVWRVLYTLLVLPADATCTQVYDTNYALRMVRLDPFIFACGCITGIMLWGMLLYYGRKKKTMALFVVPYTLFGVFSALVYMYVHHTGIAFLYLLFWLWVSRSQPDSVTHSPGTSKRLSSVPPKLRRLAKTIAACTICYILLISLWWTGCSCVNDIRLPYSGGRDLSRFIKEHHLNEYQM